MVLGENSSLPSLVWQYSGAPSRYFVQFFRTKPGETFEQLTSSENGNAFDPKSTEEFDTSLLATLKLKNVERNEEYTYTISLLDSSAKVVETHAVSIEVVGK